MKKSHSSKILIAIGISLLLILQFSMVVFANQKPILSHVMNQDHIFHRVSEVFMGELSRLSGGEFEVDYHLGGDLGDWTLQYDQCLQGIIPMTFVWNNAEIDPRQDISVLGFLADDWETARLVYGPDGLLSGEYASMMDDIGLVLGGIIPTGFCGFVVRKGVNVPINVPDEAKGFKMRISASVLGPARYKALGFSPVTIPFSEVHTALQTGTIDGRAYGPAAEVVMFADVLEAFVHTKEHLDHAFFTINKKWFESLSEEEQKWVREAAMHAQTWAWNNVEADEEAQLKDIEEHGVKVVYLTKEQRDVFKKLTREAEWPIFEKVVGPEVMQRIKDTAAKVDAVGATK
ncbi:MAG TPA: TRAP transporter substrate-binding protein DctP [Synergistales bacterium]|nr:TRAP transporter substrate-binding protein DctP [Synergistales bacterium]